MPINIIHADMNLDKFVLEQVRCCCVKRVNHNMQRSYAVHVNPYRYLKMPGVNPVFLRLLGPSQTHPTMPERSVGRYTDMKVIDAKNLTLHGSLDCTSSHAIPSYREAAERWGQPFKTLTRAIEYVDGH